MAQLIGLSFLNPKEDFEDLYKKRVGTSLDPEDRTAPQERLGWADKMPFEPKGPVESRTTEQVLPGLKPSLDLTEGALRRHGEALLPPVPTFEPMRPTTPLGRAAGAVSEPGEYLGTTTPAFAKKEVEYSTQLTPQEERDYQKWARSQGKNTKEEEQDYDLKGYYKDVVRGNPNLPDHLKERTQRERNLLWASGGRIQGHLPDTYKKPNHPTFSDESIYHGFPTDPQNMPIGGRWDMKTKTFIPSPTIMEHWNRSALQHYFDKYEPGYKVAFPDWYK